MKEEDRKAPVTEDRDTCRELVHVHIYQTFTQVADGHNHNILGVTAPARMTNGTHVHCLKGRTSFVEGHWHAYDVYTGPAVSMGDGTHIHYYTGTTSEVEDHEHDFSGATNVAPDIIRTQVVNNYPREDEE